MKIVRGQSFAVDLVYITEKKTQVYITENKLKYKLQKENVLWWMPFNISSVDIQKQIDKYYFFLNGTVNYFS